MARIVVCGAGTCGLITAMLLARDGHEVTVVERDPMEPPAPDIAWETWERRSVNQFRLPHFLMPRFRYDMARELPAVIEALVAAEAYELNFFGPFREVVPEPDRFDVITARRPVVEAAIAPVAANTPGVTIRRGVAVAGVVTGAPTRDGVPHVTGVVTESGEEIAADFVVATTGRRSPVSRWLTDAGARPPYETAEDSGFVYYGRYLQSSTGEQVVASPALADYGSIGLLLLPADRGTVGVGIIAWSQDAALRKLRHEEPWREVLRSIPGAAITADMTPISDLQAMGGIEDRYRRFVVDGAPVATGVFAVADAWAATNPTLGRGISLGVMHALHLRDFLRDDQGSPYDAALGWDDLTEREMTPWYRSTIWHDRNKIASYGTHAGLREPVNDPAWARYEALGRTMGGDLELAVSWMSRNGYLSEPPERLLDDPELVAKADAAIADPVPHDGPSRERLLAIVGA